MLYTLYYRGLDWDGVSFFRRTVFLFCVNGAVRFYKISR